MFMRDYLLLRVVQKENYPRVANSAPKELGEPVPVILGEPELGCPRWISALAR
jgi:hypothetical protein